MTTEIVKAEGYTPAVSGYKKVGTTQCGNRTEIVYEKNGSLFFLNNKTGKLEEFSEKPEEIEKIGIWGKYEDWLDRKFGGIAEIDHSKVDADDGKVGAIRAFKILGQSFVKNFIKEPLKHPFITAGLGVAAWVFPPLGTAMCVVGAGVGIYKLGKGLVNLFKAKKDEDAINAWEDTWTGGLTLGLSAWGYKKSANRLAQRRAFKKHVIDNTQEQRIKYINAKNSPKNTNMSGVGGDHSAPVSEAKEALRIAEYEAMKTYKPDPKVKGSWLEPLKAEKRFLDTDYAHLEQIDAGMPKASWLSRKKAGIWDNFKFDCKSKFGYNWYRLGNKYSNLKKSLLDADYVAEQPQQQPPQPQQAPQPNVPPQPQPQPQATQQPPSQPKTTITAESVAEGLVDSTEDSQTLPPVQSAQSPVNGAPVETDTDLPSFSWLKTAGKWALSPITRQCYIAPTYATASLLPISSDLEEEEDKEAQEVAEQEAQEAAEQAAQEAAQEAAEKVVQEVAKQKAAKQKEEIQKNEMQKVTLNGSAL